jgi:hypothetical protein
LLSSLFASFLNAISNLGTVYVDIHPPWGYVNVHSLAAIGVAVDIDINTAGACFDIDLSTRTIYVHARACVSGFTSHERARQKSSGNDRPFTNSHKNLLGR